MSIQETQTQDNDKLPDRVADMLFDQHSRYQVCADILEQLSGGKPARILDVGSGGECLLGQFMPNADITYIDPLLAKHPKRTEKMIGEDFFEADLATGSFDFVVSIDFLEHIHNDVRPKFLRRSCELATRAVLVLCPCAETGEATQLDRLISDSYQKIMGQAYPWLVDHHEMGLPLASDVTAVFDALDWSVQRTANGHTPWMRDLLLPILCFWDEDAKETAVELSKTFNREFHAYDSIPPCYRQVFIASPKAQTQDLELETRTEMPQKVQQDWLRFRTQIMEAGFKHLHRMHHRAQIAEQATGVAEQATREAKQATTNAEQATRDAEQEVQVCERGFAEILRSLPASITSDTTREERIAEIAAAIKTLKEALVSNSEHSDRLQQRVDELSTELNEIKSALVHRITRAACTAFDRVAKPFKRAKKPG